MVLSRMGWSWGGRPKNVVLSELAGRHLCAVCQHSTATDGQTEKTKKVLLWNYRKVCFGRDLQNHLVSYQNHSGSRSGIR